MLYGPTTTKNRVHCGGFIMAVFKTATKNGTLRQFYELPIFTVNCGGLNRQYYACNIMAL
jgi:hypothetical protein